MPLFFNIVGRNIELSSASSIFGNSFDLRRDIELLWRLFFFSLIPWRIERSAHSSKALLSDFFLNCKLNLSRCTLL
jgi:hypothetical protein